VRSENGAWGETKGGGREKRIFLHATLVSVCVTSYLLFAFYNIKERKKTAYQAEHYSQESRGGQMDFLTRREALGTLTRRGYTAS
jgi:hypothetical protein